MSKALEDIAAERKRQVEVEGWTPEHDDKHEIGDMAQAGACYAQHAGHFTLKQKPFRDIGGKPSMWPWERQWWKPKDARRDLVRAAALIVAEIEKMDRASARAQ